MEGRASIRWGRVVAVATALVLGGGPRPLRAETVAAVGEPAAALQTIRESTDRVARLKAADILATARDVTTAPDIVELLRPRPPARDDFQLQRRLVAALVAIGSPAIPHLQAALGDADPALRARALAVLVEMKAPGVVGRLTTLLERDAAALVRIDAVLHLSRIGDRAAIAPLRRAADQDDDPHVRKLAADAAAKLEARR